MNIRKKLTKFMLMFGSMFMLSACVLEHNFSHSYSSFSNSILDYDTYKNRTISFNQLFSINSNEYYVYVFSRTCSPCNSIKETILQLAKDMHNLFFLEYTSKMTVSSKPMNLLVGTCDLSKIYINGTPSLFKITKHKISYALSGKTKIPEYLMEECFK
jgi:hypothetical protein